MDILLVLLIMVALLLLQGFFSGSEIALVHCDKGKLRHRATQGHPGSKLALKLFQRPEIILSTTLVGTNIALVLISVFGATLMIDLFGEGGDIYAVLLFTPLMLLLGEVVPKSVYQQESDKLTPRIIYPLYAFLLLFFPIVFLFSRAARLAARLIGVGGPGAEMFAVREQLRAVLDIAEGAATVDVFDRTRIRNVVRFGELTVGDVMIPAADMTAMDASHSTADAMTLVRKSGITHIPIYEGKRSNVIGIVSLTVWDLVKPGLSERELGGLIKPAYFVPAQQSVTELLPVLRSREDQGGIVVDEYGSTVGMITVDRILESVVGRVEVGRTYEERVIAPSPSYELLEEEVYMMDARLPISDVNEILATKIGSSEAHTIGGLVLARLRHVPKEGESIIDSGYYFTVAEATDRAVTKLRVERAAKA